MKKCCYIMIFLLSFSWLLSFQENHLCSDDSSVALHATEAKDIESDSESSHEREHDKEMCHFGHCSHGVRAAVLHLSLPLALSSFFNRIPYISKPLSGITRLNLRPPALA